MDSAPKAPQGFDPGKLGKEWWRPARLLQAAGNKLIIGVGIGLAVLLVESPARMWLDVNLFSGWQSAMREAAVAKARDQMQRNYLHIDEDIYYVRGTPVPVRYWNFGKLPKRDIHISTAETDFTMKSDVMGAPPAILDYENGSFQLMRNKDDDISTLDNGKYIVAVVGQTWGLLAADDWQCVKAGYSGDEVVQAACHKRRPSGWPPPEQ